MVQVELDEISEARLEKQAQERGMKAADFAAELVKSGLDPSSDQLSPEIVERRKQAIQRILEGSRGQSLGLKEMGLTMREFMHMDHKY